MTSPQNPPQNPPLAALLSHRMPLEEWFDRYQYTVTSNIGESAITSLSLADIPLSVDELWKHPLRYGHHQGLPELRDAVPAGYDGLAGEDILITSGASEAIVLLAEVLLDRTKRAVIEHPTYPTLYLVPRSLGATVDLLRLRPENAWRPDWQEAATLLERGVEMFAITHPNNPTGSMIGAQELVDAVDLTNRTGSRLVSDETYGLMTVGQPLPAAATLDAKAVSISTMSKTFGLPGIRIGWIATRDRDLMHRLLACREHITITNNVLGEQIALRVQRNPAPFIAHAKERVAQNRAVVADLINTHPRLDWIAPEAGVVGLPWVVDASDGEAERLYLNLAQRRGTFVVPGSGFELPTKYFRVGFGGETNQLRAGLAALRAELDQLVTL